MSECHAMRASLTERFGLGNRRDVRSASKGRLLWLIRVKVRRDSDRLAQVGWRAVWWISAKSARSPAATLHRFHPPRARATRRDTSFADPLRPQRLFPPLRSILPG